MSAFVPYNNYRTTFPFLQPGNILKIQDKYYMIIQTHHNRKAVSLASSQTKYALAVTSAAALESMHGNLNKNRVVHIQYVALTVADTPEFFWGTLPLQSVAVDDTTNANLASVSGPLIVDRWSYDLTMYLLVTQGNVSQVYYFEIVEYEIVAYSGTPPRPYWQLLSNGAAILVQTSEQEANVSATQLGMTHATQKPKP